MPQSPQDNGTLSNLPLSAPTKNGRLGPESRTETDSTEVDPCLGDHEYHDDSKPKKQGFYEKHVSRLQERLGLPRKWVVIVLGLVIAIVVLVLVVLGLAIGLPKVPHVLRYPICRSPECLRAAVQVQENLESSVSPCTDLWTAVCSKYTNKSARPLDRPVWNQKEMLVQEELERIRNVISTLELPLHTGTVEWKLKHFYEACLDVNSIGMDGARPLTNIIAQLGGWYILRNWAEVDFEGMKVLTQLQVKYGISPYFKIHVEPDPHVPNTHSIRISPSGLGLPDKDYYYRDSDDPILTAYTDYIRDVVISLSSTKSDAAKFGKDMFNYEKRIAEITPDLVSLQNPITTYNAVSLAELELTTHSIPFSDILQATYPEVSVTENTEVIVTSLEYLTQLAQIISTTDRRTLNGYLIWSFVREYTPFLSENYTSAMDSFNNELFGTSKRQKRWEICARLVKKYMALASEYQLEKAYPVSENTRNILNDTFDRILKVVKDKVRTFDDTALLKQHLETKLNTINLHIGLPEFTKTNQFLKDYYSSLIVIKLNLFETMKSAIGFQKNIEKKMLLKSLHEEVFLEELAQEVPEVRYIPSRNAVVIPRSLVIEPFFENGYPRPILYGKLGVEIASAILSSVLPYGSLWTADNKILSPFHMTVNDSIKSIKPSTDCLSRFLDPKLPYLSEYRLRETALSVLTELIAVRVAHGALLGASSQESHEHYGGLEQFEESALYFLSFAQTQCAMSTSEYDLFQNTKQFRVPSKIQLQLAWSQITEFQEAFDCVTSKTEACVDIF